MKNTWQYRLRSFILPGLKRWILFIFCGIAVIVFGVLLLLEEHPVRMMLDLTNALLSDATKVLPHKISGIIAISVGGFLTAAAVGKLALSILGAYVPDERESIPDVLYRKRLLDRGPRVVVIGGGTGLSTLLRGLKQFTSNITAIVTVGDDGGSSGRLREELGVLPPGDIRNCITALADEDKLVTELFRYRFQQGNGLEGHSFGNLFLTAVCAITNGDMLEAARVATRVLNSCGQVLPSTLSGMTLEAELENGQRIVGECHIPESGAQRIRRIRCQPESPAATPEALEAIMNAEFLILGPGSLYTSIIPNLLVKGVSEAITQSRAKKVYVCNVRTQRGETSNYSVSDHVRALLEHAGFVGGSQIGAPRLVDRVLVHGDEHDGRNIPEPVRFDPEKLKALGARPMVRDVASVQSPGHHDPEKLAEALMLWYVRRKNRRVFWRNAEKKVADEPSPIAASL